MAGFLESGHYCLWRLDTQEMMTFDLDVRYSLAIIHSPHANHVFVARDNIVEILEVSMIGSNTVFETEPLTIWHVRSICPSLDDHRLLVGSGDGTVRMWNLEDSGSGRPVTQDIPRVITSPSGKMAATQIKRSAYIELWDTATWEC